MNVEPIYVTCYAYRGGVIEFAPASAGVPDGALLIATGQRGAIVPVVCGLARRAYDNATLLVPGCPEATNDTEAYEAFAKFFERVQRSLRASEVHS